MAKSTDKLTKKQVLAIPVFLNKGYRGNIWTINMAVKVKHGNSHVYLYNDKSKDLDNLWGQYGEWRKKNDWITEKQNADMEKLALDMINMATEEVPF